MTNRAQPLERVLSAADCHKGGRDVGRRPNARVRTKSLDTGHFSELVSVVTYEFRILGPLEVEGDDGPLSLGRPAAARAPRALLLGAGQVMPTERLVDRLWGEEAPRTATTSLQNSISPAQAARPGRPRDPSRPATSSASSRTRSTARRFERLLADARTARAEERAATLAGRSRSGAARLSPTSPSTISRRRRSAGSRSCASSPTRSGSTPTRARTPRRRRGGARGARRASIRCGSRSASS